MAEADTLDSWIESAIFLVISFTESYHARAAGSYLQKGCPWFSDSLATYTLIHVVISLAGIVFGLVVMYGFV